MVTIKDIAKEVGVSVTTISRYLNNDIKIMKSTANKIDAAVTKMNYTKNFNAAAMKRSKSKIVNLIFPNPRDVIFGEMADKMYKMLLKENYYISTFYTYDKLENEKKAVNTIRSMRSEGCIFVTEPYGDKSFDHLEQLATDGTNIVLVNRFSDLDNMKRLDWKIAEGSKLAVEHLITNNLKKIGIVLGWEKQNKTRLIIESLKQLFAEHNMKFNDQLIEYCFFDKSYLNNIVDRFIEEDVDGIFAMTDSIAANLIEILYEKNVRVPEDISLTSCGNSIFCRLAGITSVDLGTSYIGTKSTELLLSMMTKKAPPQIELQKPILFKRKTTF